MWQILLILGALVMLTFGYVFIRPLINAPPYQHRLHTIFASTDLTVWKVLAELF